jgi:hypothetical protein
MKFLSTVLIVSLGVTSPMSLWADTYFPCTQQFQALSPDTFVDVSTRTDMAGHDGHKSMRETISHHGGNKNSDSTDIDCKCCVSCIVVCASSVSSHGAIDSDSMGPLPANQSQLAAVAKTMNGNPDPISLFRPPKTNA